MVREGVVNKYVENGFCKGFKFEFTTWNVPWTVERFRVEIVIDHVECISVFWFLVLVLTVVRAKIVL